MRETPLLLVMQGVLLGATLMIDLVMWRWALTGPPAQRRGNMGVAILFLIIPLGVLINLLIP